MMNSAPVATANVNVTAGFLALWGLLVVADGLENRISAAEISGLKPFLKTHCFECHADGVAEGGLDLEQLGADLADRKVFAKWVRVYDRVAAGEMPPQSATKPKPAERAAVLKSLGDAITAADVARQGTVLRRLNRREYQNTLNDLFGTNLDLVHQLPEDGRSHEFDNVGESLGISLVQMQRYLEGAAAVLDEAIAKRTELPESRIVRASYADTRGAEQWLGKIWLKRDDGAVVFFKAFGYPTGMLREANVQQDGWYKIRVTGYAFQSTEPVTFSVGATTFARGLEQPTFGYYSMPPGEPTTVELKAWIPARYMIDVLPYGIGDRNNQIRLKGLAGYGGPGLAIQHIEVEGPLVDEFPSRGECLLFEGLNRREIPPRNPNDRRRPNYVAKFEIDAADPVAAVTPVITRVATKAFRRPVSAAQVVPYIELFRKERDLGVSIEEALRTAVTAIFCAPDFLYLRESAGPLDDYALASRLSYFLTRTAPDDELLGAATAGKLSRDRGELLAQTERLLKHPHAERFVTDFTDAWLNLREIDFTNPDGILFPEFDPFLKHSMIAETRGFFRKLVDDNLPVRNVVKSDFAMLNNRLAEHYGIAGVAGPEVRPVKLDSGSVRGGFLSQGAVLKVSANGTNTSPVVRGVWVMERILGQTPPPPPAGVPGVEPDIRGATTLRELLDKHRTLDTCKGCHKQIDPPGFALESFDPIGGWRDRFRSLGEGTRTDAEVRGMRVRYKIGPPVDAAGELADGRKFAGFREFRDLLAADEQALAKALATKLLTFGTGREMSFSDRAGIDRIVNETAKSGYGVRDLIRQVVASEIFRNK
jgi:mono/diheme cytochrome c family protein